MILYRLGWTGQRTFVLPTDYKRSTRVSVIIPARNEAANIGACVRSILAQDYPADLLEIIVVDDHSEDGTEGIALAESDRIRVVSLRKVLEREGTVNAYKKKALGAGIRNSRGELIVTTDADCVVPATWISHIVGCYEATRPAMVIGPVAYRKSGGLLDVFQSLDFTTMQGITAASHKLRLGGMANGANLAFSREAFEAVDGYSGSEHLASGDDYLLLHKMQQQFPDRVQYLKAREAIVRTAPQASWGKFLQQRVRWASKSGKYSDHKLTAILMIVYLFNVMLPFLAVFGFWQAEVWQWLGVMLCVKVVTELVLLYPVARFFRKSGELYLFPLLQPMHILYIVMAGFLGIKGGYSWKGREVR